MIFAGCQSQQKKDGPKVPPVKIDDTEKEIPGKEEPSTKKKLTDKEFEDEYGLSELLDNTLVKVEGIHGKSFSTADDCCKPKGKVGFTFTKGYSGKFKIRGEAGIKTVKGMYVKIVAQPDENCCKHIKIMQIKREHPLGNPGIKKWQIDSHGDSPYATDYDFAQEGTNGGSASLLDTPGRGLPKKNSHVEYMTIILCVEDGKHIPLAYIHWGFDVDATGAVKPFTPKAHCGAPKSLKGAVTSWNRAVGALPGRLPANVTLP